MSASDIQATMSTKIEVDQQQAAADYALVGTE